MNQGFSLTEVLISLLLMSTVSLLLLKQQWQISQLFNQKQAALMALIVIDNETERLDLQGSSQPHKRSPRA